MAFRTTGFGESQNEELTSLAGAWIPGLGSEDDYEVTLTFSCD